MVNSRNIKYKVKELWIEFPKQLILFQLFLFFCLLSRFLVILPLTVSGLAKVAIFTTNVDAENQTLIIHKCVCGALNRHFCQTRVMGWLKRTPIFPFFIVRAFLSARSIIKTSFNTFVACFIRRTYSETFRRFFNCII